MLLRLLLTAARTPTPDLPELRCYLRNTYCLLFKAKHRQQAFNLIYEELQCDAASSFEGGFPILVPVNGGSRYVRKLKLENVEGRKRNALRQCELLLMVRLNGLPKSLRFV